MVDLQPARSELRPSRVRGALNDSLIPRRALCWVHYTQPAAIACPHHSTGAKTVRLARIVPEWSYCAALYDGTKEALKSAENPASASITDQGAGQAHEARLSARLSP